jgi:quinoprotein glucose dehydrogenase
MDFSVNDVNPWLLSPEAYETMLQRIATARNEGPFTPPAFIDTVSMPGNQGGSNWGTTGANPKKGLVFVVNVNQVALLKLEDVKTKAGRGGANAAGQAYQRYCQVCHGADLQGVTGLGSTLVDITDRMGEDAIRAIVTSGKGTMRPVYGISDPELTAIIAYLANPNVGGRGGGGGRGGRGGRGSGPPLPPGPVVASGGAPLPPPRPPDPDPPHYGTNGGNGGNVPYPGDVEVPPARYVSEYGVMASATKPPYTTLTAFDLNTGTIKWQVPPGDDPATLARGGPANTGAVGARYGMIATKAGIVFLAGGDGKVRAYDEDSGQVLWTGTLPGSSSGIPVSYEAKGRQYVVFASLPSSFRGMNVAPSVSEDAPRGYIAFALPRR